MTSYRKPKRGPFVLALLVCFFIAFIVLNDAGSDPRVPFYAVSWEASEGVQPKLVIYCDNGLYADIGRSASKDTGESLSLYDTGLETLPYEMNQYLSKLAGNVIDGRLILATGFLGGHTTCTAELTIPSLEEGQSFWAAVAMNHDLDLKQAMTQALPKSGSFRVSVRGDGNASLRVSSKDKKVFLEVQEDNSHSVHFPF